MVRLHLLGDLRLEVDGSYVALASLSHKARLLLAIVATERRVHGRSELAGRLWPDVREESARVSLRTALSQLRRGLGPAAALVLRGERDGGVALAAAVSTDVEDVEKLLADGRPEAALERCSAELLPGLDDDRMLARRDELRDRIAQHLAMAADAADEAGDLGRAVDLTRRVAALDPLAETAHRELIRRLAAAGDRGAALAAFDRFRDRLAQELRIAPSAATRGLVEEIRAERAAHTPAIGLPAMAPPGARGTFVGREAELAALAGEWDRVQRGERRVVALAGEPGIGKTRLAAELCVGAHAGGALVLAGRAHEDGLIPYEPFVDALRCYVAECPDQALRDQVGAHAPVLAALVPELADRLGVDLDPGEGLSATRLVEAIAAFVRAAAGSRSAVLLLEDLHWAEEASAVALRHLVRGTEGARLLVLVTYRDTEVEPEHPLVDALAEARRARVLCEIELSGLDERSVGSIVAAEAGREPPPELIAAVHERTAGNPFFIEELVREGGDLRPEQLAVPRSVQDLLTRRLRGMAPADLRLLETAAVIGTDFRLEILSSATGCPDAELVDALDAASKAHAIVPAEARDTYSFAHALVRETVYAGITGVRRAYLHRLVGDALEATVSAADDARPAALAHHFSAAGDDMRAFHYHAVAAQAAARVDALRAGLEHCDAALDIARSLGAAVASHERVAAVELERGRILLHMGIDNQAVETLEQALDDARTAGDPDLESRILTEFMHTFRGMEVGRALDAAESALALAQGRSDVAGQIRALGRASLLYTDQLLLDRAAENGERALTLARGLGDESSIAEALDALKLVACQLGDTERLGRLASELESIQRRRGALWYLAFTLQEAAHVPLAALRLDEAEARLGEALSIAERIGSSGACAMVLDSLAAVHEARGSLDAAIATSERAIGCAQQGRFTGMIAWMQATAGLMLARVRAGGRAGEHLERGFDMAEAVGSRHEMLRCAAGLAWARWLSGEEQEALGLAERAEGLCSAIRTPPGHALLIVAPAMAATAEVFTAAGQPERAEHLVLAPLQAARGPERAWYAIPLAIAAARCLTALGRRRDAATALAPALGAWRTGSFAPAWESLVVQLALDRADGREEDCVQHAREARMAVSALSARLADAGLREGFSRAVEREIATYAGTSSQTTS
jgi:DNA-binding SARP family transcriptional activator/tetratricopeptide (TPR) repeat protein